MPSDEACTSVNSMGAPRIGSTAKLNPMPAMSRVSAASVGRSGSAERRLNGMTEPSSKFVERRAEGNERRTGKHAWNLLWHQSIRYPNNQPCLPWKPEIAAIRTDNKGETKTLTSNVRAPGSLGRKWRFRLRRWHFPKSLVCRSRARDARRPAFRHERSQRVIKE
jgi:hypothetical protein